MTRRLLIANRLRRCVLIAPRMVCLAALISLGGCIDSADPLFSAAQPLLGAKTALHFYALRDGAAHEPEDGSYRWDGTRYVLTGGTATDIGDFTVHAFAGDDLIVQSIRAGKPAEYALARKLAEGTYLVFPVDETDADEATRQKFCSTQAGTACRVATPEAVLAIARASAAKPRSTGGLVVVVAEP